MPRVIIGSSVTRAEKDFPEQFFENLFAGQGEIPRLNYRCVSFV
jgi:hypothetical protein